MYIFSNHFTLTLMVGKEKPLTVEIYTLVWFLAQKVNRQQNDLICTFNVTGLLIAKTFCTSYEKNCKDALKNSWVIHQRLTRVSSIEGLLFTSSTFHC